MTTPPAAAQVQTLLVHYRTPDLLGAAVSSFRAAYPEAPVHIVDNGSGPADADFVRSLAADSGGLVTADFLEANVFHGPALDRALRASEAPYCFVLDSDTVTRRPGFLEPMLAWLREDPARRYGIGQRVCADRRGFAAAAGTPVLASAYMLLDRRRYLTLPPFVHHGLPALANFRAAAAAGLELGAFPIEQYVDHLGRGTAARYGYGLGLRSKWDYLLHRLGL